VSECDVPVGVEENDNKIRSGSSIFDLGEEEDT
jgi:hypothetical protein